jgi:hypothetical protein
MTFRGHQRSITGAITNGQTSATTAVAMVPLIWGAGVIRLVTLLVGIGRHLLDLHRRPLTE